MKRWAATAAMLLALLGVAMAPAHADPTNVPNPFTFEITCGDTTYSVVGVPGGGVWTPVLVTDSNQVLVLRGPRTETFPHQQEPAQVRDVRPARLSSGDP